MAPAPEPGDRVRAADHAPSLLLAGQLGVVLGAGPPNLPHCVMVRWDAPAIGDKPINILYIERL